MKVTIAVPIYGVEPYIEKCATSLFEQTYDNIEFLFVNDCTKDKSVEIIENTLIKFPNRRKQVRIINLPDNKGCPAVRNLAVQIATGDFILFVDGDDYIEKDSILSLVEEQEKENADLVVANYLIETKETKCLRKYCDIAKNKQNIVIDCLDDKSSQSVWGILIRRSLYIDNNIKANETFHVGEDWQVAPLLLYYAERIAYVDKVVYHYLLSRPNSITITSQATVSKKKAQLICFVKTMNCLLESFKDKGQVYLDVIYKKKAVLVQDAMIYCCMDHDRNSFQYLLSEKRKINDKYIQCLGNNNYIVSKLKDNYWGMSLMLFVKDLCK